MDFSRFFVVRPIFAAVISILIFMVGLIAMFQLPISEYPEVAPPTVQVRASFPGANPKVISETVATPLEEQINGVENMIYMYSQATSDGSLALTVTFKLGTDPDLAAQLVQNRVNQALPRLPEITRTLGVTTTKSTPDLTMVVHLKSPNGRYDNLHLRNYALLNVKDELARISGVGMVNVFGSGDYAMRIWLNPKKIAERGLTASEVVAQIRKQNTQIAAGIIGGPPYPDQAMIQLQVNAKGRLESVEEFENIIVKRDSFGAITSLKDIARIEIDASSYGLKSLLDNKDAVGIPIFQTAGANSIEISDNVRETMARLAQDFPEGIEYDIAYDPTVFVRGSIEAVIHTLIEALVLVVIVVIVFLQTWRASIIPLLAVPVSIVGTFAVMHAFGFSINALSLFGLVLAIGIVVDDAIVIVENVERNIENGLSPREATFQAMKEVTGPIIAITLVLCAVFIPIAFISGLSGQFYRQFALTIAFSTVISAINSLTLSPALSALLLKSHDAPKDPLTKLIDFCFGWFFRPFNRFFNTSSRGYSKVVGGTLKAKSVMVILYACILAGAYFLYVAVPKGFVPMQDKQYLIAFAQLPEGATLDRTTDVMKRMTDLVTKEEGVAHAIGFPGLSINGFMNSSSAGIIFVSLKPFEERTKLSESAFALSGTLNQKFKENIKDAFVMILPPPPVRGLGTAGGFKLQIEDRGDLGYEALADVVKNVTTKAYQSPVLQGVFSNYKITTPQLYADLDRTKAMQLGLDIQDIFSTMQVYLGSLYVNDFNKFGRTYQVIAQADKEFRANPDDILQLQVKNQAGQMTPLGSVMTVEKTTGPESTMRYNGYRSADINGDVKPGFSSGQGQAEITKILNETLPKGMTFEWTDLTYQQILAGNTVMYIFPLCVFLVFLVLAAQYESLFLPISIILIVPTCLFSAILGVWLVGGDNNLFTEISLFVLAALSCKNAILIVEFAHELERSGRTMVQAAIEAAHLRLRPILMTSFAFIMGSVPLVMATGPGAEMRHAMGIAVFSGMLGVTFFGLLLTPVFYVILRKLENLISGENSYKSSH